MVVRTYIADSKNKVKNIQYTYASGQHSMQFSNNVIQLSAVTALATNKSDITNVNLGYNVLSVLAESFSGCVNLTSIQFSNKLTFIGSKAFQECGVQKISFPESILSIGLQAFYKCSQAKEVYFPSHPIYLGASSFEQSGIQQINVNLAQSSGSAIFKNATDLKTAYVNGQLTKQMFYGCSNLKTVDCNSTIALPNQCFYGNSALTSINYSNKLVSIGQECFYGCSSLLKLNLEKTKVSFIPNDFIGNSGITELILPNTISSIFNLDTNCFRNSQLIRVKCLGMSDEYMISNKDQFNRFGASHNMDFVSASGTVWTLNSNGIGLKPKIIYVISIGIQYTGDYILPKMYNDIARFCSMIQTTYGQSDINVVYSKLGDGGDAQQSATKDHVIAALDAAVQAQPDILLFHFSGHGITGKIKLSNDYLNNTELYEYFSQFKRVFAILCCCYPWSNVDPNNANNSVILQSSNRQNLNIDVDYSQAQSLGEEFVKYMEAKKKNQNKLLMASNQLNEMQALIWCAGKKDQVTWMDTDIGHRLMTALTNRFSANDSYNQNWKNAEKDSNFSYKENGYQTVIPQKVNYNNFDEKMRMFT